jgi:hypothetical protein
LFLAVMLALWGVSSSAEVAGAGDVQSLDDGGDPAAGDDLGDPAPTNVVVEVSPSAPKIPEPTIVDLLPRHIKRLTAKFVAENGGKQPSVRDDIEIRRLAVIEAGNEINDSVQAKDALEKAGRKEQRLNKQVEHDYKTIYKAEQNTDYAARKQYVRADMKVKKLEKVHRKDKDKEEAFKETREMNKMIDKNAAKDRKHVQKLVDKAKQEYKKVEASERKAQEHVDSADALAKQSESAVEMQKLEVSKRKNFLNSIEAHEAKASLHYRQAKIIADFQSNNARKVRSTLTRLKMKRDSILAFTKSLDKKSSLDFKASEEGIAKAKQKYADAKTMYDEYTKKAGQYEADYQKTLALVARVKKEVITAIDSGNDAAAIKGAERHKIYAKREKKDQAKVVAEDHNAKGQQEVMNAALTELSKSEALETVARKQKDMVKQHRFTLKKQNTKIDALEEEAKKHTALARSATRAAKEAEYTVKELRTRTIDDRNDAQAAERYARNIEVPMAKRMKEKADVKLAREKFKAKEERAHINNLQGDKIQITINARKARKENREMKDRLRTAEKAARVSNGILETAQQKRDKALEHNQKKMKEIKDRLHEADLHFKSAKADTKDPAATPSL